MAFELFPERAQYADETEFDAQHSIEVEKLRNVRAQNSSALTAAAQSSIDLNVHLLPGQSDNPRWHDENGLHHIAYHILRATKTHERRFYIPQTITAFPTLFGHPSVIPIGTIRTSIVKFWVGFGALRQRDDSYLETILSPKQLANTSCAWEPVHVPKLNDKNFRRIRIVL